MATSKNPERARFQVIFLPTCPQAGFTRQIFVGIIALFQGNLTKYGEKIAGRLP